MTLDDLYPLFDADRGTLSTSSHRSFLKEVQAQGLTYAPYAQRVGPGFATASSELKRALDAAVLPAFQDVLSRVTSQRFNQVYCDVRNIAVRYGSHGISFILIKIKVFSNKFSCKVIC